MKSWAKLVVSIAVKTSRLWCAFCNASNVPAAVTLPTTWWHDANSREGTFCTAALWLCHLGTTAWHRQCHAVAAQHVWTDYWMASAPGTMWSAAKKHTTVSRMPTPHSLHYSSVIHSIIISWHRCFCRPTLFIP